MGVNRLEKVRKPIRTQDRMARAFYHKSEMVPFSFLSLKSAQKIDKLWGL
jgi:hypothetical protein